ncbi:MAG: hypothetical protein AB1646_19100 [Thermodesulfobacteriota bacterium]
MHTHKRILVLAMCAAVLGLLVPAHADNLNPGKVSASSLPSDLFVAQAPQNALGVGEARKGAQEGKQIVVKGRIGGIAQPIANKYAIFLLVDLGLAPCEDACGNNFCRIDQGTLMANLATVQVVDSGGRPLKVSMAGMNGLKPLVPVVVQGTVAKKDANVLIINARRIFVDGKAQATVY